MARFTARYYTAFPVSAATHNGDIVISRTPDMIPTDVQLFENGQFTVDMAYMPDGTPVVDADGNAIISNQFLRMFVYSSYQDDTCLLVSIELICLPQHLQIQITLIRKLKTFKSQSCYWAQVILLSQPLLQIGPHVYVKQPEITPETLRRALPRSLSNLRLSQLPDTADYSQISVSRHTCRSSVSLVSLELFLRESCKGNLGT